MKTIHEISEDTNPCRDIVEGQTKLRTVRTIPFQEFVCPPAPSDEITTVPLPSRRIIKKYSSVTLDPITEAK